MSASYYEEYKANGVSSVGEIPPTWGIIAIKRFARFIYGDALPTQERDPNGTVPVYGSNGPVGNHSVANTDNPVVLVGRKGSCGALNWSDEPVFAIDTVYFVDKQYCTCNLRWLYWALHTAQFETSSQDTGVPGLSREIAHSTKLPVPSIDDQMVIARFLDAETAKIDILVREQEKLIALLKEKRHAVISQAVTKGLDPSVPMKDTGIEWLGEVPEHWELAPLKRLVSSIESGTSVNGMNVPAGEGEIGVLKVSCVSTGEFLPSENKTVLPEDVDRVSCSPQVGGIIVSRASGSRELVGSAGIVRDETARLFLSDKLWQMTFLHDDPSFIHYWTLTAAYRVQVEIACPNAGTSMHNLSREQFSRFIIPRPPSSEQWEIVTYIGQMVNEIDKLRISAEVASQLLRERRSALVSAAVTGKIDVRDLVTDEVTV